MKLNEGVYRFHLVHPCVHSSVCTSVCEQNHVHSKSCQIHFIFTHLINQHQNVCHVLSLSSNFKIWMFVEFFLLQIVGPTIWPWTWTPPITHNHINGLVKERRNSTALIMELRLSCTKPSIYKEYIKAVNNGVGMNENLSCIFFPCWGLQDYLCGQHDLVFHWNMNYYMGVLPHFSYLLKLNLLASNTTTTIWLSVIFPYWIIEELNNQCWASE